jgi:hypothetical protein
MKLTEFRKNIYSQFGEDGVIEKIFEIIAPSSKVCIEFGAWDGYHYSNTANLWANNGWTGILIEGDEKRYEKLKQNIEGHKCLAICKYVGLEEGNTLEDILKKHKITDIIDLLSIDIDGDDYHILSTLEYLRPSVIICEYNPTIPYWLDIYSMPGLQLGSSVASLVRISREKGYGLVALTDTNCVFVEKNHLPKFKEFNTRIDDLAKKEYLNVIITSYKGNHFVYGQFPFGIAGKSIYGVIANAEVMRAIKNNSIFILKLPWVGSIVRIFNKIWWTCLRKKRKIESYFCK